MIAIAIILIFIIGTVILIGCIAYWVNISRLGYQQYAT